MVRLRRRRTSTSRSPCTAPGAERAASRGTREIAGASHAIAVSQPDAVAATHRRGRPGLRREPPATRPDRRGGVPTASGPGAPPPSPKKQPCPRHRLPTAHGRRRRALRRLRRRRRSAAPSRSCCCTAIPYDIHSYVEVVPLLVEAGFRVLVPYLRGHGATRFLDPRRRPIGAAGGARRRCARRSSTRSHLEQPILAGYDWGGRAACVVAALWPERISGLVSGERLSHPGHRGRRQRRSVPTSRPASGTSGTSPPSAAWRGLDGDRARDRRGDLAAQLARVGLRRTPTSTAAADVVRQPRLRGRRHPLVPPPARPRARGRRSTRSSSGASPTLPPISVPTITLDGMADGNFPATDGAPHARFFTGPREHRRIPHAGPQPARRGAARVRRGDRRRSRSPRATAPGHRDQPAVSRSPSSPLRNAKAVASDLPRTPSLR